MMPFVSVHSKIGDRCHRHFRLVSLLDMLRFYAQSFVSSSCTITQISHILNRAEALNDSHVTPFARALGEMQRECEKVELPMTTKQIQRMKKAVDEGTFGQFSDMRRQLDDLLSRLWDELDGHIFYEIESTKSQYVDEKWLFDTPLQSQFPNGWKELQSGGRCYAYGESTACAFHLSRALEWGLKSLAVHLGKSFDRNSWDAHLKDIEKELTARYQSSGARTSQEHFYSEAATQFAHMKVAWRNPTMHIEAHYDEREGQYLLVTVEKFMQHLAANGLKE